MCSPEKWHLKITIIIIKEDRFDTHRLFKSVRPCLAGCTPAENSPERCLTVPNTMDPGLAS